MPGSRPLVGLLLIGWAIGSLASCASQPAPRPPTRVTPRATAAPAQAAPTPAATPASSGPSHTTILLIDMSGSMGGSDGNDPDDIRCAAARTFVGLSRPGELVGLIGFSGLTATSWTEGGKPVETSSAGRSQLEEDVSSKCPGKATGFTPTADALAQAFSQLDASVGHGTGSVVLLTDGVPEPNGADQLARIDGTLIPAFQQRGWRIDTIALGIGQGSPIDFDFLKRLSGQTGGQFYDGSQGKKATAFNLLSAFVDVLRREAGRSPGQDVVEQGTGSLSFTVAPLAGHLDVVVGCRDKCPEVTLRTPAGAPVGVLQPVSSSTSADKYGAIFSVDHPPPALHEGSTLVPWTVTVSGGGDARVESIVDLPLEVAIQPVPPPLPLGKPFTVAAAVVLTDLTPHADDTLTLVGTAKRGPDGREIAFSLSQTQPGSNQYRGTVTIPATEPAGSYDLTIAAVHDRGLEPLATVSGAVEIGQFPVPSVPATTVTALRWPGLAAIFTVPPFSWFAGRALQGVPLTPEAAVTGTLTPDTTRPIIDAEVSGPGLGQVAVTRVVAGGHGDFHAWFPAPASGVYHLTLHTGGPNSFGQTIATTVTLHVAVEGTTAAQDVGAAAWTLPPLALLLFLLGYVWLVCLRRPPYGTWKEEGESWDKPLVPDRDLARALRSRNQARSEAPEEGLEFKFTYGRGILVRPDPHGGGERWTRENGDALPAVFEAEHRLRHDGRLYVIDEGSTGRHWFRDALRALGIPVAMPEPDEPAEQKEEDDNAW